MIHLLTADVQQNLKIYLENIFHSFKNKSKLIPELCYSVGQIRHLCVFLCV